MIANGVWRADNVRVEQTFSSIGDTDFSLRFTITNEGTSDFIVRFRLEDFSVVDDTGKAYASANSVGPKTMRLSANSSDYITLSFKGTLNPKAKQIILRLTQLSDVRSISIAIPIGSDISSLRIEPTFSSVGDTDFSLRFTITNEGTSDFIARFRLEDFSVVDDTGKAYASANSVGPKTIRLSANGSDYITLSFKGALNPNAKALTLRLAQLSGTPDISKEIPIGSDISSLRIEPIFSSIGDTDFSLRFKMTNEGTSDFIARFRLEDFSVVDDMGKAYASANSVGPKTIRLSANGSDYITLSFKGALNPNAKVLTLRLAQLSGTPDISKEIPIGSDISSLRIEPTFSSVGDTDFSLRFKMTNEGTSDFIARFRLEDFSVVDDTGKAYASANSVGPKTIRLSANGSDYITLSFKGAFNPNAKVLTLRLAQLSGTPDISKEIPITR